MLHIISGQNKNQRLSTPKGSETRPTSALLRAALFNILQNNIDGMNVLDLCAGSGAVGLEALSRGANRAVFVENSRNAFHCITSNITSLKAEPQCTVFRMDAQQALQHFAKKNLTFDLIYIDPPYDAKGHWNNKICSLGTMLVYLIDSLNLLSKEGWLFIEGGHKQTPAEFENLAHLRCIDSRNYGNSSLITLRN